MPLILNLINPSLQLVLFIVPAFMKAFFEIKNGTHQMGGAGGGPFGFTITAEWRTEKYRRILFCIFFNKKRELNMEFSLFREDLLPSIIIILNVMHIRTQWLGFWSW